jgi:hypothetical protein
MFHHSSQVDSTVTVPGINLPYNSQTSPVTHSSHAVIRSQSCGSAFKVSNPQAYIHNNIAHHEPQRKHTLTQDVKESQIQHNRKNTPTHGCEKFSDHSAPVDVVEEIPHKSPSLLTGRQQLGQQISFIVMCVDIACPPFVFGHAFADKMVCNTLGLLL